MDLNIKKGILSGLSGIILLSGCVTFTPKGSIDIAYVPHRADDQIVKNEIMTELDVGLEAKIVEGKLKDTKIRVGGRQRTYATPKSLFSFDPERQEYDVYGNIRYKNIKIYVEFMCSHPVVDEKEFWVYDEKTEKSYWINHDSIIKIGAKLEF